MSTSEAAEQLLRRMQAVRSHLAEDVDDVVRSAKRMVDWHEYVQRYPWAFVLAAASVGYLLVPRRLEIRSPDPRSLLELAKHNQLVVQANPPPQPRQGIMGGVLHLAANALMRGALGYLSHQMSKGAGEHPSGAAGR